MAVAQTDAQTPTAVAARRSARRRNERSVRALLLACSAVSILTTFGIIAALFEGTAEFFGEVSIREFFTSRQWSPTFADAHFGILPLVSNTIEVAVLASLVGLPVGLASAIFLSEYASERVRRVIKPTLELLAGVPTVVFGYFALTWVTPNLKGIIPNIQVFNALSAAIVVGVMTIPLVASLSEDAMRAVPRSLREGAYALGGSRFHVATRVVVPAALSGIAASFVLAVSRAIGETMIIVIAAGANPQVAWHPLEAIQTMASFIAQVSQGDTPTGSIAYKTIFATGATLFVLTLLMNLLAIRLVARFRQEYQ
jgi:phosphate transport system permease protein